MNYALAYLQEHQSPAQVILLNTYFPPGMNLIASELIQKHDETRRLSIEGLQKELRYLQGITPDHPISYETLAHMGRLENVMGHLVKSQKVHSVMMGQDGKVRKLDGIECPLFLIPVEAVYRGFKNIAFLDGPQNGLSLISPEVYQEMIGSSPSHLFILTEGVGKTASDFCRASWSRLYAGSPHTFHSLENLSRDLNPFLDQKKIDLLVCYSKTSLPIPLKVPVLLMNSGYLR